MHFVKKRIDKRSIKETMNKEEHEERESAPEKKYSKRKIGGKAKKKDERCKKCAWGREANSNASSTFYFEQQRKHRKQTEIKKRDRRIEQK